MNQKDKALERAVKKDIKRLLARFGYTSDSKVCWTRVLKSFYKILNKYETKRKD